MTAANENWDPCPAGQITSMATALRSKQRQANLKWLAGAGGGAALITTVLLGAVLVWSQSTTPSALTCQDVIAHFGDYQQGLLPASLVASIRDHLDGCPSCQQHYERGASGNVWAVPETGVRTTVDVRPATHSVLVASARQVSPLPVSALPVSALPVSALPVSALPVSARHVSAG